MLFFVFQPRLKSASLNHHNRTVFGYFDAGTCKNILKFLVFCPRIKNNSFRFQFQNIVIPRQLVFGTRYKVTV